MQSLAYTLGAQTLFSLTYGYTQNGGNNGQITNITDNVQSIRTGNFSYDALDRITSGATTGGSAQYPQWGLQWTYDRFGSRIAQSQIPSGGGGPINSVTPSTSSDLIYQPVPPYTYEPRGNMTGDGLNALAYDAENRLLTNTDGVVTTYGYDGRNLRVTKASGGTTTVYIFSGGKVIAEYANGSLGNEYVYLDDKLLATHSGSTLTYHHQDHLSVRVNTEGTSGSPNFGQVVGEQGHYPFGEQWYTIGTTTKWMFTSYERDPESSNDYAMYRYHANRLGRFTSPDPVDGSSANPQSLNRYAYTLNDPVNRIDPTGLCTIELIPVNGHFTLIEVCGPRIAWPYLPFLREGGGGDGSLGLPAVEVKVEKENCYGGVQVDQTCTYGCTGEDNHFLFGFWITTLGDVRRKCPGGWDTLVCPLRIDKETTFYCIYGICLGKTIKYTRCS